MTRHVFYSFHYAPDNWRASQIRNIGKVEGNKPAHDNDWETVTKGGNIAIKNWISAQMKGRSCTVVLVGNKTADRRWINHEIIKSWDDGMGVVGINIHGILDANKNTTAQGSNPFQYIGYGDSGKKLSSIVKCYSPSGIDSKAKYNWISNNIEAAVEEAIKIRNAN